MAIYQLYNKHTPPIERADTPPKTLPRKRTIFPKRHFPKILQFEAFMGVKSYGY